MQGSQHLGLPMWYADELPPVSVQVHADELPPVSVQITCTELPLYLCINTLSLLV